MNLSTEEQEERRKLVGFCDKDQEWYKFVDDLDDPDSRLCPHCGGKSSHKIGFQLTTQRTFNPAAKRLSKAAQKKIGMVV